MRPHLNTTTDLEKKITLLNHSLTWTEEKSPDAYAPKIAEPTSTDSLSRGSTQGSPVKKYFFILFKIFLQKLLRNKSNVISRSSYWYWQSLPSFSDFPVIMLQILIIKQYHTWNPLLDFQWNWPVTSAWVWINNSFLLRPPQRKRVVMQCPALFRLSMMWRVPCWKNEKKQQP